MPLLAPRFSLGLIGSAALVLALAVPLVGCDSGITSGDGRIYPSGRHFGQAIALDSDVAVVGANDTDEAFVLGYTGGAWQTEARLRPPGGLPEEALFGWSVALDGNVVAVGAPVFGVASQTVPGRAYVYERRGGTWAETAELLPPEPMPDRSFGLPVAVSGGRVAVSVGPVVTRPEGALVVPAAVLLYERSGAGWDETVRVEETEFEPASGLGGASMFGLGMALDGDRLAVGSPGQDVGEVRGVGVVRVFEHSGAAWPLAATLTAPDLRKDDMLGEVVALDGPVLAASALGRNVEGGIGGGSAFAFRETGGTWAFEAELRPPDLTVRDSYGFAIDADSGPGGDRIAVSAVGRAGTRGSVFVWVRRPSGAWELEDELWPEGVERGALFGEGVALDGDRLLAGAIGVGGRRGGVYEFRLGPDGWQQVFD